VKEALPDTAHDKPTEIWFQDEARIGQKGTLTRIWARIGSRPRAPRDSRYEWAYLFGAVCPECAIGAALVMPYANSEAMNLHLREIGRAVAPGAHAILVLDGAGWHTSHVLDPPGNITLLCLPPYSPELNPGRERLGVSAQEQPRPAHLRYLRRHCRRLLQCLERPRRHSRKATINYTTPMGCDVMTSVGWYKCALQAPLGLGDNQLETRSDLAARRTFVCG
jgi:DDE superfamily endonuclease